MALTTDDLIESAPRVIDTPIISADSHITEPAWTYADHVEEAYRDQVPFLTDDPPDGATFHIPGMRTKIHLGLHSAAGKSSDALAMKGVSFDELHRAGWDAEARVGAQQTDGLDGEVIYPSVGMLLCNHPDPDLKKAWFDGYNRWIAEYCAIAPDRLYGCGQTALRSVDEGIADLETIAAAGLRGVMLPGEPATLAEDGSADYDDPMWDPFYRAANDLGLVLSFHILTGKAYKPRGPKLNSFMSIIRGNQDLIGTLVFGGVFDRVPELRIVCVEADAGWVPHYRYRMDHAYNRHRNWLRGWRRPGAPAQRVLRRAHLCHVPGRLVGVPHGRSRPARGRPAAVGQRLPPQRLHLALQPGDARHPHRRPVGRRPGPDPGWQRDRAVRPPRPVPHSVTGPVVPWC